MADRAQDEFPLADFIEKVAQELREAQKRHRDTGDLTLLELAECTLEMAVTWDRRADGGVDLKVIKLGGGLDKTNTQTIRVTMQPPVVLSSGTLGPSPNLRPGLGVNWDPTLIKPSGRRGEDETAR